MFLAAVLAVAALRLVFPKVGARAELVALCVSSQSQYKGIGPLVPFTSDLDMMSRTISKHASKAIQEAKEHLCRLPAETLRLMPIWIVPSLLASSLDRSHIQQYTRHSQLALSKTHQLDDLTKAPVQQA